jgi:hypothetical protein
MLRRERDREAEERRTNAMNKLVEILVEAVVKEPAEVDDVRENREQQSRSDETVGAGVPGM